MQPGVLLVRPQDQVGPLEDALAKQGHRVFHQAVIETRSVAIEEAQWQRFTTEYDGVVVVSPAAVGYFDQQLNAHQRTWPRGPYYCVGSGTAEALVPLTGQPAMYPAPAYTADALIELDELRHVEGQQWLFVTGRNGRPLIADTLLERGANLDILEVYERVPLKPDLRGPFSEWTESVGVIVITSQQQVELFWAAVQDIPGARTWLESCIWVVSSARLQNSLLNYGIAETHIVQAQNAGRSALMRAVDTAVETFTRTLTPSSSSEQPAVVSPNAVTGPGEHATEPNQDELMTKKEQTPISKPDEARAKTRQVDAPARRSALSTLLMVLILLCIVTLAAGGYWAWAQQEEYRQQTSNQMRELNERIDGANRAQETLRDGVFEQVDARLSERFEQLERERQREAASQRQTAAQERQSLRDELEEARQAMLDDFDQQSSDLQQLKSEVDMANLRVSADLYLVEARDLVLAAGRKLWFDYDRNTAVQLLTRAEQLLGDAGDNHVLPIRQQLRDDIAMLEGIEDQDLEDLAMRISAQRRLIRDLPLHEQAAGLAGAADDADVSSDFSEWRANLAKAWANFTDDFVRIQRTDEMPPLQIGQEHRALIVSQIELQLQIAQHTLMQRETIAYREAIEQSMEWIEAYFDGERQAVQHTLSELDELRKANLDPSYPTRLLSEAMLRDAVDELLEGASR